MDSNTSDARKSSFARVCVKINLDKPVVGKVWLKGFWYKVEYESLIEFAHHVVVMVT